MAGTTYQEVVEAVGRYYGVGSDQWLQIAQYGVAAHDAESILSQVPDVDIIKNNAGQVTAYAYNAPSTINTGGVASDINSNIASGTQANGNTFQASIPASGTVNQSGNLDVTSGAKKVTDNSTVSTVLGKISTGVAAVSMGCKLGAFIDGLIYNSNPNYWDDVFPTINPQTWNTIAGTNKAGKYFLNALFGTDSNGNTTMYLPEDVASYLAYALSQQGFFNTGQGDGSATIADTTGLNQGVISLMPIPCGTSCGDNYYTFDYSTLEHTAPLYGWNVINSGIAYPVVCSSEPFSGNAKLISTTNPNEKYNYGVQPASTTINNKTVYYYRFNNKAWGLSDNPSPSPINTGLGNVAQVSYVICYGTVSLPTPKDGVTPQPDTTYPDTTNWTSPAATGQALATQFSDDYQNKAIYTDVPQPDGTTTRIKYIPVPATPTTGAGQNQPVNTSVTYNETVVNQGISTEDLLNTIVRYMTHTETETTSETPEPPDTPNPSDTGQGTTPPVVTPTGNASSLFAVYNPSQENLNSFGAWLWSSNFIDQVLKLFNNPMQAIIGLHKIFATPPTSGAANIHVGYLDSGVSANVVSSQYVTINCGSVKVAEQFGNVFDYTDTNIRIYLPFIGIVDLDTSDVMRGNVSVIYHVDVITGACLAEVKISRDANGGTLYQFSGDASVRYPISSGSYMGMVSGIMSAVGGVASAIMSGGATLPLAAGAVVGGIGSAKTNVQHSGSFAGNAGAMGAKKPYIIIERPQTMIADHFERYQGLGANKIVSVGSMSGYFKMADVRTDSITGASEQEIEQIKTLLESGVIA